MATNPIQQLPQSTPIGDQRGLVTSQWAWWFRQLLNRLLSVDANFGQGRQL